jgi:hypothetical protein
MQVEIVEEILKFLSPEDLTKIKLCGEFIYTIIDFNSEIKANILLYQHNQHNNDIVTQFLWASQKGYTNVLRVLHKRHCISKNTYLHAFNLAIKKEQLDVMYWIFETYRIEAHSYSPLTGGINYIFQRGIEVGNLPLLKWLYYAFNLSENEIVDASIGFLFAAQYNYLNILIWLYSTFKLANLSIPSCIRVAAENGNLKVLQWLDSTFNPSKEEYKSCDIYAYRYAIQNNHLEVLKWLHSTSNLTLKELKKDDFGVFTMAAEHGYLEIIKWLYGTFNLKRYKGKITENVFMLALENEDLNMMKWVYNNNNISKRWLALSYEKSFQNRHRKAINWLRKLNTHCKTQDLTVGRLQSFHFPGPVVLSSRVEQHSMELPHC